MTHVTDKRTAVRYRGRHAMNSKATPTVRSRVTVIALLLGLASFTQSWLAIDGSDRISGDPGRDMQIALNMIRHGEFHDTPALAWNRQQGTLRAYADTEPAFPTFLALIFWNAPEMVESIGVPCFRRNQQCREGDAARTRVLQVGAISRGMTVAAASAATFALTGSLLFTVLGGFACLLLLVINWSTMSVLAGLFLLTHSVLAALAWRQPRIATGALSGVALGLLVLTRAIFQYWLAGVAVVWLLGAWLYPDRRRATAPAFAALVIAAWTTTFPWLVRNASYAGVLGVSGGDAQVLAIRAEYGRMSWPELQGAFAYYVPTFLGSARDWAMNVLEPPVYGYARLARDNPEGFYRQANTWTGETARQADLIAPGWRDRDPVLPRSHATAGRVGHVPGTVAEASCAVGGVCVAWQRRPGAASARGGLGSDALPTWLHAGVPIPASGLGRTVAFRRDPFHPALRLPVHALGRRRVRSDATHYRVAVDAR